MWRGRKLGIYSGVEQLLHPDFNGFLNSPNESGVHTFKISNWIVDVLYEDRSAKSELLLVTFPDELDEQGTWPYFCGRNLADALQASLLSFSDPGLRTSPALPTNYYLGSRLLDFPTVISQTIQKFANQKTIVFLGKGAGGFAALYHGKFRPDSYTIVCDPVTNVLSDELFLTKTHNLSFPGLSLQQITEMRDLVIQESSNRILIFQDYSKHDAFSAQILPYFNQNLANDRLQIRLGIWSLNLSMTDLLPVEEYIRKILDLPEWKASFGSIGEKFYSTELLQARRAELEEEDSL